jgi:1-acyl-sn-glycerol-3-phosphate acyltransferase
MRDRLIRITWAAILLSTTPALLYVKILKKLGFQRATDRAVTVSSKFILKLINRATGCHVKIFGAEKVPRNETVVFISNHEGHLDSTILHEVIPVQSAFISIVSSLKLPVISSWMKEMHCVFMDRSDLRQSAQTVLDAIELVRSGYNMAVFPEGHTSGGPFMNEFHRGSFNLAFRTGVKIVPITVNSSYKLMGYHGELLKPALVTVYFSDPIPTAGADRQGEKEIFDRVVAAISANLIPDDDGKGNKGEKNG